MANPILPTPDAGPALNIRPTEGASDAMAKGILGLANTALDVDKQLAVARLQRDVDTASQAYATVEQKAAGIDNILLDKDYRTLSGVRLNPEENEQYFEELKMQTDKLRGLKSASRQGALSPVAFRMRVEQITRDAIARRPGLRAELVAAASSTLGFDPLGQGLRELMSATGAKQELTAFQRGQEKTEEEVGALFQAMRATTPTDVPDQIVEARARETVAMDKRAAAMTKLVDFAKGQATFTEGIVDSIASTVDGSMDVALFKSFATATAQDFLDPKAFNADLTNLLNNQIEGINQIHAQFKDMPAYNADPLSRAIVEKRIAKMKEDAQQTFMLMQREFDAVQARGETSANAEIAKERLSQIMWLKARIQPRWPGFWATLSANNFNMLGTTVPNDMSLGTDVMHAIQSLSTGKLKLGPAKPPANGAPPKPQAWTAPENSGYISAAVNGLEGPQTNDAIADAARGHGLMAGKLFEEISYQGTGPRPEQVVALKNHVKNLLPALQIGAGDSTDANGKPLQFSKAVVGRPRVMTNAEYGARQLAVAAFTHPEVVEKLDDETKAEVSNVFKAGYIAFTNQLMSRNGGIVHRIVQDATDKGGKTRQFVLVKVVEGPQGPTLMVDYKDKSYAGRKLAQQVYDTVSDAVYELNTYARGISITQPDAKEAILKQFKEIESVWSSNV